MAPENEQETEYNVFRHSPLRYLGYANEVGEAFRYQLPKCVVPSYILSIGYAFSDAVNSGRTAYNGAIQQDPSSAPLVCVVSTFDTLIWQSLASVIVPGGAIHCIVRASRLALSKSPMVIPATVSTWVPTAIGLGSIPLIIHPIDHGVDMFMDSTYRQIDFPVVVSGKKS